MQCVNDASEQDCSLHGSQDPVRRFEFRPYRITISHQQLLASDARVLFPYLTV